MANEEIKEEDPLIEWNDLNKENAIQEIVSAGYISVTETTQAIDKFSIWLLAGTGATGALLVSQIDTTLPYLTSKGFKWCMIFLVVSGVFGFIAKFYAIGCEIQVHTSARVNELLKPILALHNRDKSEIERYASERKMHLETGFTMEEVLNEYLRPFKGITRWFINRSLTNKEFDRQTRYHNAIKLYMKQTRWTILQAASFIIFLCVATYFANGV